MLTVISLMFMSVFSFLTISGGHEEPAIIPEAQNKWTMMPQILTVPNSLSVLKFLTSFD